MVKNFPFFAAVIDPFPDELVSDCPFRLLPFSYANEGRPFSCYAKQFFS